MVKSKNKKSVIALVVMAFLLVASIVLAATGAWFTSKDSKDVSGTINFGTVKVAVNTTDSKITTAEGLYVPGDTVSYTVKFTNESDVAISYKYIITFAWEGEGATDLVAPDDITSGVKTAEASAELTSETGSVEIPTTLGNDAQGKTATLKATIKIAAIQQENVTDAETELDTILANVGA